MADKTFDEYQLTEELRSYAAEKHTAEMKLLNLQLEIVEITKEMVLKTKKAQEEL